MNIQDTFQRANNSNINTNAPFAWAIQESSLADFSISNNQLALPITASIHSLRAEVDLTQNHYCEVTVVTSNADDSGAICRFDSAGANYYAYDWTAGQQKRRHPLQPPSVISNIIRVMIAHPNLQTQFTNYEPTPIGAQPLPAPRHCQNLLATTLIPVTASSPFSRICPPPPATQTLPLPPR